MSVAIPRTNAPPMSNNTEYSVVSTTRNATATAVTSSVILVSNKTVAPREHKMTMCNACSQKIKDDSMSVGQCVPTYTNAGQKHTQNL